MTIRVVLADDHPIVLDGLEQLFRAEGGIDVVARCGECDDTIAAILDLRPDVAVIDLWMPAGGGLGVLRALRGHDLPTRIVVLTAGLNEADMTGSVHLGAKGVILKESPPEELVLCVKAVAEGGTWLKLPFLQRAPDSSGVVPEADLTARESEIVRLLGHGLRNKEIARRLHITEGTVKVHLHRIYTKLGTDGRLALLRWAEHRGLV